MQCRNWPPMQCVSIVVLIKVWNMPATMMDTYLCPTAGPFRNNAIVLIHCILLVLQKKKKKKSQCPFKTKAPNTVYITASTNTGMPPCVSHWRCKWGCGLKNFISKTPLPADHFWTYFQLHTVLPEPIWVYWKQCGWSSYRMHGCFPNSAGRPVRHMGLLPWGSHAFVKVWYGAPSLKHFLMRRFSIFVTYVLCTCHWDKFKHSRMLPFSFSQGSENRMRKRQNLHNKQPVVILVRGLHS